jgi:hypothetical protein
MDEFEVKLVNWEVRYDIPKPVRHSHSGRVASQKSLVFERVVLRLTQGKDPCAGRLLIMEVRVEP